MRSLEKPVKLESSVVNNPKEFIFGGKAEFTIRNTNSGRFYKYRITQSKNNEDIYFVKYTTSKDSWEYAGFLKVMKGTLFDDGEYIVKYSKGRNGTLDENAPAIKGIFYAIKHGDGPLPEPMEMTHHGRCCCCGKPLTNKTSVERGYGPECRKRLRFK